MTRSLICLVVLSYDIILDCAGKGSQYATEVPWRYHHYVTFTSPTLKNIDAMGLACGAAKNIFEIVQDNIKSLTTQQGFIKWAYFVPAPHGIDYLKNLVDRNKVSPSCCHFSNILILKFDFSCYQLLKRSTILKQLMKPIRELLPDIYVVKLF